MVELYGRKPNTNCIVCGALVYKRPFQIEKNRGRVFCTQACFGKSTRKEIACRGCGKTILSGQNKQTCSRECANKLRAGIRYGIGRPRDKMMEQRSMKLQIIRLRGGLCERCKYDCVEILHVHHKDRNRKNNNPQNLELLCPNCHAKEHRLENL